VFLQDTEFTVQDGKLFMLQTRNGKRTGPAALKIAIDLEAEVREQILLFRSTSRALWLARFCLQSCLTACAASGVVMCRSFYSCSTLSVKSTDWLCALLLWL
jgi:hypothetical protein